MIALKHQNESYDRNKTDKQKGMQMEQKRITWIDGLRGAASLFIVFHHFIMGYYPAAYKGAEGVPPLKEGVEAAFSQSLAGFVGFRILFDQRVCDCLPGLSYEG